MILGYNHHWADAVGYPPALVGKPASVLRAVGAWWPDPVFASYEKGTHSFYRWINK